MLIVVRRHRLKYSGRYTGDADNQLTNATPFSLIVYHNGDIAQLAEQLRKRCVSRVQVPLSPLKLELPSEEISIKADCNVVRLDSVPP